ncbi:MAG: putative DNA binding domain-containing protein [Chloroflexi bacterium]|nr:putative DNA binding domain-containing protein [Chloroflexota bacterium]
MKAKSITPDKAKNAKRESKRVERKEKFDINQARDWCEIIKDVVAMANSGGGCILVGVKNDGTPSGWDPTPVLNLDPADITNKVAKYTGEQFDGFDIQEVEKNGYSIAVLQVHGVSIPMVFIEPGTYDLGDGKSRIAFAKGTVYFRHGAKSEPANSNDLRQCIDREVERLRRSWLGNIREVVEAPFGSQVSILPPWVTGSTPPSRTPIRIVNDPTVPAHREIDRDKTHPHRKKEVIQLVNQRLSGRKEINSRDVICVRKVHRIDQTKPEFYHSPRYSSPQYSDAFVDWLVEKYEKNPSFFDKAREEYKRH